MLKQSNFQFGYKAYVKHHLLETECHLSNIYIYGMVPKIYIVKYQTSGNYSQLLLKFICNIILDTSAQVNIWVFFSQIK